MFSAMAEHTAGTGFYGVEESCLKGPSYGAFAAGQEEELHAVAATHYDVRCSFFNKTS